MRYVLFALALFVVLPAHAGKSPPKITLRVHVQTTGDGLSQNQAQTVFLPPNGEPIQLRALPEASEHNLVSVDPRPGGTLLSFDHDGQINLSAVTAQNQGRILVVFINGFIVYAPVIDEQITNGQLLIPHELAPHIIQQLQDLAKKNVRNASRQ
jgi:preprotein translocase subunit SecD